MKRIEKGTLLHRTQEESPILQFRKCSDTGKIGCYLSENIEICLGMVYERDCDLWIHTYRLEEDLFLSYTKYGFRNLNPKRYFTSDGDLIINIEPIEEENISHYDDNIRPIVDEINIDELCFNKQFSEIFLTKNQEISSLKHIGSIFIEKKDSVDLLLKRLL